MHSTSDDLTFPVPTPEEAAALERARELNRMDPHQFLEFVKHFIREHPPGRDVKSPNDEPFRL